MMGDSICYFQYGGQERPLFERVALELEGIGNEPKKDLEENLSIERHRPEMVVKIAYLEKSKKASMSDCKNRQTCTRLTWKGSYGPIL